MLFRSRSSLTWLAVVLCLSCLARAQSLESQGQGLGGFPRYVGPIDAETAVRLGLEQSLAVAISQTDLRLERGNLAEAQGATRPQASLNGFAVRNSMTMISQSAPGVMPGYLQAYPSPGAASASLSLMMPLFTGGALEHQLQAAEQAEKAAVARAAFTLRETARLIRVRYFALQTTRSTLKTLDWKLTQAEELDRIAAEQLEQGRIAPFELLRAQSEVAGIRQEINEATSELQEREADLKVAMGVAMDSFFEYVEEPSVPAEPSALPLLVETALVQRADLVAARFAVEESDRLVAAAVSEYAPKAYLAGMGESMTTSPFSSGGMSETGYSVGVVLSIPVFDGGIRKAREDRARARLDERKLRLRQLELEVSGQVMVSRTRLMTALENLELSRVELARASEEWRIALLRQKAGRSLYLEVLDSLATLALARDNNNKALYTAHSAEAELLYAIGGLTR